MKKTLLAIDTFLPNELDFLQKFIIFGGNEATTTPSTPSTGPHTLGGGEQNEASTPPIDDDENWKNGGFGNETP